MATPFDRAIRDQIWRQQQEIRQQSFPRPADSPDSGRFDESKRRVPLIQFFSDLFGGRPKQNEPFQPLNPAEYGDAAVAKFNAMPLASRAMHMMEYPEEYAGFTREQKRAMLGMGPDFKSEALQFGQEGAAYEGGKVPKPQPQDPSTFHKPTPTPAFPVAPPRKPFSNPVGRSGAESYGAEAAIGGASYRAPAPQQLLPNATTVAPPPNAPLMPRAVASGYSEPQTPFSSSQPIGLLRPDQLLAEHTRLSDPSQYRPGTETAKADRDIAQRYEGDSAAYMARKEELDTSGKAAKSQLYKKAGEPDIQIPDVTTRAGKLQAKRAATAGYTAFGMPTQNIEGTPDDFGMELTKSMQTTVQKELLETQGTLGQLDIIENEYRDAYMTIPGRAAIAGIQFVGGKMFPGIFPDGSWPRELVDGYNQWATTSYAALNKYIHDITGAQLSEFEAKRIRKAFPDPGDTVFDTTGAYKYQSAMKAVLMDLRRANARRQYVLNTQGLTDVGEKSDAYGVPLTEITGIMENFADRVQGELIAADPSMTDMEVIRAVDANVVNMFGVHLADVIDE